LILWYQNSYWKYGISYTMVMYCNTEQIIVSLKASYFYMWK
jgi:hypothetical protein